MLHRYAPASGVDLLPGDLGEVAKTVFEIVSSCNRLEGQRCSARDLENRPAVVPVSSIASQDELPRCDYGGEESVFAGEPMSPLSDSE